MQIACLTWLEVLQQCTVSQQVFGAFRNVCLNVWVCLNLDKNIPIFACTVLFWDNSLTFDFFSRLLHLFHFLKPYSRKKTRKDIQRYKLELLYWCFVVHPVKSTVDELVLGDTATLVPVCDPQPINILTSHHGWTRPWWYCHSFPCQ